MYTKSIVVIGAFGVLSLGAVTATASDATSFEAGQGQETSPSAEEMIAQTSTASAASVGGVARPSASKAQARPYGPSNSLQCVQVFATTWKNCKDAGGFDSTCATAKCGAGYRLTGGGGSCAAGNRKLKSLSPKLSTGEFGIMCEKQGVKPQVSAICCKA